MNLKQVRSQTNAKKRNMKIKLDHEQVITKEKEKLSRIVAIYIFRSWQMLPALSLVIFVQRAVSR